MKKRGLIISLSGVLVLIIGGFVSLMISQKPETEAGAKEISVTVVFKDNSQKVYDIDTDAEVLSGALLEEELISKEEAESGFVTVVAGERADYNADGRWWCITKDGEMTPKGINETPIEDGDKFEITSTES